MPHYYFNLKDGDGLVVDVDGSDMPNDAHALDHAQHVAAELMLNREPRTRSWRLQVCDGERRPRFELLFATIDNTIGHLSSEYRSMVETACGRSAALSDAISDVRVTLHEIRATMARADNAPYLAAVNGVAFR